MTHTSKVLKRLLTSFFFFLLVCPPPLCLHLSLQTYILTHKHYHYCRPVQLNTQLFPVLASIIVTVITCLVEVELVCAESYRKAVWKNGAEWKSPQHTLGDLTRPFATKVLSNRRVCLIWQDRCGVHRSPECYHCMTEVKQHWWQNCRHDLNTDALRQLAIQKICRCLSAYFYIYANACRIWVYFMKI